MQPDEFLQKNYLYFQEWQHWHDKAVTLQRAARRVYNSVLPELRRFERARRVALKTLERDTVVPIRCAEPDVLPAFLLYGVALENAFKGLMVSKDTSLIGSHRLSNKLKSHKLVDLAGNAGIALAPNEHQVLKWVSEVVIWKGRYPVPTDPQTSKFFHSLDQVSLNSVTSCIHTLGVVFARTKKQLPRRLKRVRFPVLVRLDD